MWSRTPPGLWVAGLTWPGRCGILDIEHDALCGNAGGRLADHVTVQPLPAMPPDGSCQRGASESEQIPGAAKVVGQRAGVDEIPGTGSHRFAFEQWPTGDGIEIPGTVRGMARWMRYLLCQLPEEIVR